MQSKREIEEETRGREIYILYVLSATSDTGEPTAGRSTPTSSPNGLRKKKWKI
jgi:hypothetical protein